MPNNLIFPSNHPSRSAEFTIGPLEIGVVTFANMRPKDQVCVEIYMGGACSTLWTPFSPTCCGAQCICYPQNQMIITTPARYRLVFTNDTAEAALIGDSWFEEVVAKVRDLPHDSNIQSQGCSDMSCALTQEEIQAMIDAAPDKHVSATGTSASGHTLVMNDGEVFQLPLTSVDGSVQIIGGDLSVTHPAFPAFPTAIDNVSAICADANARIALEQCMPSLCDRIAGLPISTTKIGG